ncbi:hypothetical protein RJ639_003615 [Escallonia herrerae]|uniref:Uncharacterized protein n=1 Tax=Escallonia herrerae TaxID=1293975 RepID=A0AA89AYB5_9ASTE|nr:hypothetical protein RJ639_003615 [Escallonia herrerae]
MGDFNLALVIVAIVVCVLVCIFNVYLLVNYQHPDDKNQAYFPKFVVVLGLSVAAISILMLPADVANRQACRHAIYNGACNLTLPMKDLWLAVYILDAILVFFVIPFAMSVGKRIKSALLWGNSLGQMRRYVMEYEDTMARLCFQFKIWRSAVLELLENYASGRGMKTDGTQFLILIGASDVEYRKLMRAELKRLVGKVDFTVRHLSSATTSFPGSWDFSSSLQCIGGSGVHQCSAYSASPSSETTWTMRATFPEYVVALATIAGSVLFSIFGGVGIACLPLGLIFSFIRRPKAVITRSQYIKEATELGKKARELKKAADALHQEERSGSKGRKWRKNMKAVEKELLLLEEDVNALEEMYPQGEKAETAWAMTILGYLAKLVLGVLGPSGYCSICLLLLLSSACCGCWGNDAWLKTRFHYYSPNEVTIFLLPMYVIQFCSTAFAYYAQATAAQEIFSHTLQSLRGIKYLYKSVSNLSLFCDSFDETHISPYLQFCYRDGEEKSPAAEALVEFFHICVLGLPLETVFNAQ